MRDQLEQLVQEMLDKGILYDDARREFEKMFITRALQRSKGNVGDAAELLGLHRNTVARKMAEYRIKKLDARTGSSPSPRAPISTRPSDCLTRLARLHRISSRSRLSAKPQGSSGFSLQRALTSHDPLNLYNSE